RPRAAYAAMVSRLDQEVGIILDEVKKSGQEKNTLILFMSDNGATIPGIGGADTRFFNSNSNLRGYKTELYDGAIRVPCLASWPGKIKRGTVNHSVIAAWDWLPTLAEITSSNPGRSDLDGISLAPALFENKLLTPDRYLYWEYASAGGIRAIRKGDWKLLWFTKTREGQLYNLKTDIGETNNVISEQPEITKQLLALMKSAHSTSRIMAWNKYE
ncbi:MAG: sulfatase-like hydrolase/transferase, partial [Saprospiraceae bacterium]|nr:sulfatase-like hydrolase/transferase [Saprospiraceae bacterium]